jgi:hypothetical protein
VNEIMSYLREQEKYNLPKCTYMSMQPEINEKMRAILVDWLIEVHLKFKLRAETLFIAISILDRFLEKDKV